jgi:hypothetical protein
MDAGRRGNLSNDGACGWMNANVDASSTGTRQPTRGQTTDQTSFARIRPYMSI